MKKALKEALPILYTLKKAGYKAYFVGGCVRDSLLNLPIDDIDITTSATPEIVQKLFDKVIPVGIDHGTVIVRYSNKSYEVTTYRLKEEDFSLNHKNIPNDMLEFDLKRRDFTMNALAMDYQGNIIDLFNGTNDIKSQLIRAVESAKDRFEEDPLRILRAVRFKSQLSFSIEENTKKSLIHLKSLLENVAEERLLQEFEKMLHGKNIDKSLQIIFETGISEHLPNFSTLPKQFSEIVDKFRPLFHFSSFIALISYLENKDVSKSWTKKWKASNESRKEAKQLYEILNVFKKDNLNNWLIYHLDDKFFNDFIQLIYMLFNKSIEFKKINQMKKQLPIQQRAELAIDGHDLLNLFPNRSPGKWLQQCLTMLEYKVVQRQLDNNKNVLKEWIKCHPPEKN